MKDYTYAKIAYDGYLSASGGKSLVSGEPLPEFDALSEAIKDAWAAAADAVVDELQCHMDWNED